MLDPAGANPLDDLLDSGSTGVLGAGAHPAIAIDKPTKEIHFAFIASDYESYPRKIFRSSMKTPQAHQMRRGVNSSDIRGGENFVFGTVTVEHERERNGRLLWELISGHDQRDELN